MGKLENTVETYLNEQVELLGGQTRKWVSPQHSNVPDRIVFLPSGYTWFIEVKAFGKKPSKGQYRELLKLKALGNKVGWVCSLKGVDSFLKQFHIQNDIRVVFDGDKFSEGFK